MWLPGRYRRLRARRPLLADVALVVVASCLVWPAVDWWLRGALVSLPFEFYDWEVYVETIDRWRAGESLYVRREDLGYHRGYLYPPLALLLFYPFVALFDFATGAVLWAVLSVGLLWVGLQLLIRELGYRLAWWERLVLAWALVGFQPLLLAIKMGQTPAFLVGLLCLAYVALARQERGPEGASATATDAGAAADQRSSRLAYLSGALTGVVGFVKFSYAPVGAHLLADRRRLAGAVATGLALVVASVALFGVEAHLTYLDVLEWGVRFGNDARPPEIARPTYFMPLNWLPGSLAVRVGASLAIAATALSSTDRSRETFALGLAAFPLLTPTGYSYYLVAVIPAALVVLAGELERDGRPLIPVLAVGLANAQVHGTRFLAGTLPEYLPLLDLATPIYPLFQPGLWGTVALTWLAYRRVAETATLPAPGEWFGPATGR